MERQLKNNSLFDPSTPVPTVAEASAPLGVIYSKLFSILIGRNMDRLLESSTNKQNPPTQGWTIRPDTRIFMSKTMFIIAETILILYIVVTATLYMRRPWRVLARMPTTPASIIAFFAASNAIEVFRNTAGLSRKQRESKLESLDHRYGFGSFVGTDGKTHIGIEKHPFLAGLTRSKGGTSLTWTTSGLTDKEDEKSESWWMLKRWKSGPIREGGWI